MAELKVPSAGQRRDFLLRVVIFVNGVLVDPEVIRKKIHADDVIIAVNGGLHHCMQLQIQPSILIGDLDSLSPVDLQVLRKESIEVISYPKNKDETDLELALLHACSLGAEEAIIFGALGARWDQTIANLLLVNHKALASLNIEYQHGNQSIFPITGEKYILGNPGDIVSLIPIGGHARGITTEGLFYPLNNETLQMGSTRGVSNILVENQARIVVRRGRLLCFILHHKNGSTPTEEKNEG